MSKTLQKSYEITNAKISFVSLVDKAANKRTFLVTKAAAGKANFSTYGRILKADVQSHYVTGIVYEPMEEDTHGNYMTANEICKAAHWFMKNGNKVDLQHSFEPLEKASVVESWVAKSDAEIEGQSVKKGTWLMTVEVTDPDVWERIEKGQITGFSMGGLGDYSEEDVNLEKEIKSTATSIEKKGLLKQLADALGFKVVEKGSVAELYDKRTKGTRFWDAVSSLEATLRHYDPITDTYTYEQDEGKIRECLQDFDSIIASILSAADPIAKAIQGERSVEKAGKAMSGKNLETLHGIKDSLDAFLESFEPERDEDSTNPEKHEANEPASGRDEDPGDGKTANDSGEQAVTKEENHMTQQEVEAIVTAAIEKAMSKPPETISEQAIQKMIDQAVKKALAPITKHQEPSAVTPEQLEGMITKAVETAVAPVFKEKALPTNLGNSTVEKSAERHYLHGIL